ncbi:MAG TPA: hypothetical protein VFU55_13225 [Terracidiphilus sp.]|nr:hypothetical protein [Terracidiphilus sp.]
MDDSLFVTGRRTYLLDMRDSSITQPIEDGNDAMLKPAGTWRKWIPTIVMVSWVYVASSLLLYEASATVNCILLGGIIGFTVVLIGLSIAVGQVFPFATGLIFLGTLLSSISLLDAGSFSFPPDHWKIGVVLAGSAALVLSPWIRRIIKHPSILHRRVFLDEKPEPRVERDSKGDVQILIKLDRNFDFLRKPRCIVTIRSPRRSARSAGEMLKSDSDRRERPSAEHDHKLPFWVRG